jgi:hypothetical protein
MSNQPVQSPAPRAHAAGTSLPRTGVAVWFVDDDPPAEPADRADLRNAAGRVAGHRALSGLLHAYGVASRPRSRRCRLCGGRHGKPGVAGRFEYSLSHSGEHAVVATSLDHAVGVDLEQPRHWPGLPAWLDRLDPRERAAASRPPAPSTAALLDCWTRHEATGKALGCGLAHGLGELGRAGRGELRGVRVHAVLVPPLRGASCSVAITDVGPATGARTTVHVGRWTASGPVVDSVREVKRGDER